MILATERPTIEANQSEDEQLIEKLSKYYHSEYVAMHKPWILNIPFKEWSQHQMQLKQVKVR